MASPPSSALTTTTTTTTTPAPTPTSGRGITTTFRVCLILRKWCCNLSCWWCGARLRHCGFGAHYVLGVVCTEVTDAIEEVPLAVG